MGISISPLRVFFDIFQVDLSDSEDEEEGAGDGKGGGGAGGGGAGGGEGKAGEDGEMGRSRGRVAGELGVNKKGTPLYSK